MNQRFAAHLVLIGICLWSPFAEAQTAASLTNRERKSDVSNVVEAPPLSRFDLDFKGGTPQQLVDAIAAAQGRPLNAIIPTEYASVPLPALKMKSVTVPELFRALSSATQIAKAVRSGPGGAIQMNSEKIEFRTDGLFTNEAVWYVRREGFLPPPKEKDCRYFLLEPYLKRGLTVDDVTTALQTGWRMLGETDQPRLSYHRETTLLVVVGEQQQLQIVESMLHVLANKSEKTPPVAAKPDTALQTAK